MPQPSLTDTKRKRVLSLRSQGLSNREIAERAGVAVGTVSNVLREAGLLAKQVKATAENRKKVVDEVRKGGTFEEIGKRAGVPRSTAAKYAKMPLPVEKPKAAGMPEPLALSWTPYTVTTAGTWGIISDIHVPCHDKQTVEAFVAECRRRKVVGVILNGDILDSHEVSRHDRDPSMLRYKEEIEMGEKLLGWLRSQLPNVEIIFKHGNHDERAFKYILNRAPALEGLEGIGIKEWLHFKDYGVDEVSDKRIIHLGKLHVLHGHELGQGGGISPARWLCLKAGASAICGHFHRLSAYHDRTIANKEVGYWSTGASCYMHPAYAPANKWQRGYAMVELANDGTFQVENRHVMG